MKEKIGLVIARLGAKLWEPAFSRVNYDDYIHLRLSEKVGCRICIFGIKFAGYDVQQTLQKMLHYGNDGRKTDA